MNDHFLQHILFIDIETVPVASQWSELDTRLQSEWQRKFHTLPNEYSSYEDHFFHRAGIFAEYGKVVVIGLGYLIKEKEEWHLRTKTLFDHDEKKLLTQFAELLEATCTKATWRFCAHNGKEFDYPFIARRMLAQGVSLPTMLQLSGKKPWEIPHLDTLDLWRFGDYKHYTSLELLASVFNVPSSKSNMRGDQVAEAYYIHSAIEQIAEYCREDVIVTARVFLSMQQKGKILSSNIS